MILLGIGFIMIAGVFPVAIQQTAAVSDETQATAIARDAIKKIQAVAESMGSISLFPPTGTTAAPQVWAITTTTAGVDMRTPANNTGLLAALGADSFFTADHRYGWVGFYRRDSVNNPFAQIYVIALQNPNFSNYLYTSVANTIPGPVPPPVPPLPYGYSPPAVAVASAIPAQFFYNADGTTTAVLSYSTSSTPAQTPNGVTGAFVLLAATGGSGPTVPANFIGRFFRLGNTAPLPSSITATGTVIYQTFVLQSGYDITPADATANTWTAGSGTPVFTANVWCIGAAPLADASGGFTGSFSGPNQDIGVASAFIRVNTANN
ncbi:MAG: hypothetical protein ABSH08_13995 [Tepidisphaeraceae bacterium]